MRAAAGFEQVHHVLEVIDKTTLLAAEGNTLRVFLQCSDDRLVNTTVVHQVNDLRTHTLQKPSHEIDIRIVPVKQ